MTKHQRTVLLTAIAAVVLIVTGAFIYRYARYGGVVHCPDGSHPRIDASAFATQYTGYSVKVEGKLRQDRSLLLDFGERQLQAMSEGIQAARLHMQVLAEGYNGCVVSPEQYNQSRNEFETLNSIAGRIDSLTSNQHRSSSDNVELKKLIDEYIRVARTIARDYR